MSDISYRVTVNFQTWSDIYDTSSAADKQMDGPKCMQMSLRYYLGDADPLLPSSLLLKLSLILVLVTAESTSGVEVDTGSTLSLLARTNWSKTAAEYRPEKKRHHYYGLLLFG